jgi:hypothetical protein
MSSTSQSSTNTPMPDPSSGSSIISRPPGVALVASCNLCSAAMRSSASGKALGGSSTTCSHPTGGEPGGEMRKFFSIAGGRRWVPSGGVTGVGSARKTRRTKAGLKARESEHGVVWYAGGRHTSLESHRSPTRRNTSWLRQHCPLIHRRRRRAQKFSGAPTHGFSRVMRSGRVGHPLHAGGRRGWVTG